MKCPVEITSAHLVYDRSRTVVDWSCPRERYLGYEYEGKGLRPESEAVHFFTGSENHNALSSIASQQLDVLAGTREAVAIDALAEAARSAIFNYHCPEDLRGVDDVAVYAHEQASLTEGLLRGFFKHVWPTLIATYDIVAIEEEMFYIHDQYGRGTLDGKFVMMVKPDLVLRNKETGELVYYEYKTTSSKKEGWINSWEDQVQVHSTVAAIEQSLGEKPTSTIVQGLYKGYESYGKQSSPFCYAYYRQGTPPFSQPEYSYEYRNGLRRVPTWELEGGLKKWVENMPANVLADQFPQTPPIFYNDSLITDYFMQRAMRELEIKMGKQMIASDDPQTKRVALNGCFPQRFDKCKPAWGSKCQFRLLCHGNVSDPLKAGFTLREPHHELEIEQQKAAESTADQPTSRGDVAQQEGAQALNGEGS